MRHLVMAILGAAWGTGVAIIFVCLRDEELRNFDREWEGSFQEWLSEEKEDTVSGSGKAPG